MNPWSWPVAPVVYFCHFLRAIITVVSSSTATGTDDIRDPAAKIITVNVPFILPNLSNSTVFHPKSEGLEIEIDYNVLQILDIQEDPLFCFNWTIQMDNFYIESCVPIDHIPIQINFPDLEKYGWSKLECNLVASVLVDCEETLKTNLELLNGQGTLYNPSQQAFSYTIFVSPPHGAGVERFGDLKMYLGTQSSFLDKWTVRLAEQLKCAIDDFISLNELSARLAAGTIVGVGRASIFIVAKSMLHESNRSHKKAYIACFPEDLDCLELLQSTTNIKYIRNLQPLFFFPAETNSFDEEPQSSCQYAFPNLITASNNSENCFQAMIRNLDVQLPLQVDYFIVDKAPQNVMQLRLFEYFVWKARLGVFGIGSPRWAQKLGLGDRAMVLDNGSWGGAAYFVDSRFPFSHSHAFLAPRLPVDGYLATQLSSLEYDFLSGYVRTTQPPVENTPKDLVAEQTKPEHKIHHCGQHEEDVLEKYSTVQFNHRYGMNEARITNFCAQLSGSAGGEATINVLLFHPEESPPLIEAEHLQTLTEQGQYGFRYGWEFSHSDEPAGVFFDAPWVRSGVGLLLQPAFPYHITHFVESSALLIHAALHPHLYPWVRRLRFVLLPSVVGARELAWNKGFLHLVLRFVGLATGAVPRVLYREDLLPTSMGGLLSDRQGQPAAAERKETPPPGAHGAQPASGSGGLVCFEEGALAGLAASEFGFFASVAEAEAFRATAFRLLGLAAAPPAPAAPPPPPPPPNARLRLVLDARKHTRRIANLGEVLAAVAALGLFDVGFLRGHLGLFDRGAFAEQVAALARADVLVGVHGAGLTNGVWMAGGAGVVVDLLPEGFVEYTLSTPLRSAGQRCLFVRARRARGCAPPPPACRGLTPYEAGSPACLGHVLNCDVEVDVGALDLALRQAVGLARLGRRRRRGGGWRDAPVAEWRRGLLTDGRAEPLLP